MRLRFKALEKSSKPSLNVSRSCSSKSFSSSNSAIVSVSSMISRSRLVKLFFKLDISWFLCAQLLQLIDPLGGGEQGLGRGLNTTGELITMGSDLRLYSSTACFRARASSFWCCSSVVFFFSSRSLSFSSFALSLRSFSVCWIRSLMGLTIKRHWVSMTSVPFLRIRLSFLASST